MVSKEIKELMFTGLEKYFKSFDSFNISKGFEDSSNVLLLKGQNEFGVNKIAVIPQYQHSNGNTGDERIKLRISLKNQGFSLLNVFLKGEKLKEGFFNNLKEEDSKKHNGTLIKYSLQDKLSMLKLMKAEQEVVQSYLIQKLTPHLLYWNLDLGLDNFKEGLECYSLEKVLFDYSGYPEGNNIWSRVSHDNPIRKSQTLYVPKKLDLKQMSEESFRLFGIDFNEMYNRSENLDHFDFNAKDYSDAGHIDDAGHFDNKLDLLDKEDLFSGTESPVFVSELAYR